ncbi:hypothetical protein B0H16DRAFT_1694126 [Mycena metata]|uniref:Uncharacterized protein n=1 Tax=Mycena metata TaxID=1033252 RepID=A0AAD7IES0_9AGAR|nr:hypothetical protein B0H16DRAFT_1694126 [Mycena metata]
MVAFNFFLAALVAISVTARPITLGDLEKEAAASVAAGNVGTDSDAGAFGIGGGQNQQAAADNQQSEFAAAATAAAAAEAAAGVDITASIAAASSSAAAAAATATVNPLDPFPQNNQGLTPEQLGALSGLRAKLQIDTQFNDTGAIASDNDAIEAAISVNDGSGF